MADKKTPKQRELTPEELEALEAAAMGSEDTPGAETATPSGRQLTDAELIALEDAAAKASATPPVDPGFWSTVAHGLGQGYFKQGYDELAGAMGRARGDMVGNGLRMPDGSVRYVANEGEAYRAARDREREIERGMREFRPKTAFAANMIGDLASDAALRFMGVPIGSTPYQVASGALSGFLGSDAELSTENTRPIDAVRAAEAAGVGGVMGYYVPKIGNQIARALPGAMARLRQGLEGSALEQAKKVLTGGSGQLANRKPLADEVAREALDSDAIPLFGTTTGAAKRLEVKAAERSERYADLLKRLQEQGVQGPEVETLARRLAAEAEDIRNNSGSNKSVANLFDAEADNARAVAPNGFVLVGESPMAVQPTTTLAQVPPPKTRVAPPRDPVTKKFLPKSQWPKDYSPAPVSAPTPSVDVSPAVRPEPRPIATAPYAEPIPGPKATRFPLSQAERIKRILQDEATYGRIEDTPINEAKKKIASFYREGIEDAVEEAGAAAPPRSELAGLADEFKPVKSQLARTLAARDAARRGAGKEAHRMSGGAADVNFFDVANAAEATGQKGLPALALAAAGRFWKERRPSTFANLYDVGAEAAGNLSKAAYANPDMTRELARAFTGPFGRQIAASTAAENLFTPEDDKSARMQRALADYLRRSAEGAR